MSGKKLAYMLGLMSQISDMFDDSNNIRYRKWKTHSRTPEEFDEHKRKREKRKKERQNKKKARRNK